MERALSWLSASAAAVLDAAAGASPLWLLAAVALHLLGQLARARAWHGVLAATWSRVPRRAVLAAHVGCAGLGELLSPRGADLLRLAVARRRLRACGDVTLPALAGTVLVEGALETVVGIGLTAWVVGLGLERAGGGGAAPALLAGGAALALALLAWGRLRRRLAGIARELARGLAVLARPREFVVQVLGWQALSRALRLAALACFLAAFALPVTFAAVALLAVVVGSGRALPLPAIGAGAAAGALVAAFPTVTGVEGHGAAVAALALAMPALLAALGVALAVPLLGWVLGVRSPRRLAGALRAVRAEATPVEAPAPAR